MFDITFNLVAFVVMAVLVNAVVYGGITLSYFMDKRRYDPTEAKQARQARALKEAQPSERSRSGSSRSQRTSTPSSAPHPGQA